MATLATAYSHHHLSQHQQLMHNGTSSSGTISLDGGAVAEQAAADEEYIATFFVRALYDYQSEDPSSLSFKKKDIIEVLTRLESGWWDGLLNDERGWFPSNYVEIITAQEADSHLRPSESSSSIAPSESSESIVDMASVMGGGQDDDWMDDSTADLRNALSGAALAKPVSITSSADFWVPNVGADGQVYYINTQTGERSRDLPQEADDDMSDTDLAGLSSPQSSSRAGTGMSLGLNAPLEQGSVNEVAGFGVQKRSGTPEPWVRRLADDGMSYYYWNKHTDEVRWTAPDKPSRQGNGTVAVRRDAVVEAISVSSLASHSPHGYEMFQSLRSESAMSQTQETSTGDGTSVYSDESDVQPRAQERAAVANPLQRSIAQAHQAGTLELTSAEQAAQALQSALAAPPPPTVAELATAVQHAIADIVSCVHEVDLAQPEHAQSLQDRVSTVVTTIRDLLYVTALPSGTVPDDLAAEGDEARAHVQAQLKPTQRKVTATLSKLVLSVRALQYDADVVMDNAAGKVEADGLELKTALQAFVLDVQRYHRHSSLGAKRVRGTFSSDNLGLGLLGGGAAASWKGFGFVPLDEEDGAPGKMLGSDVLAELRDMVKQLVSHLHSFSTAVQTPSRDMASRVTGYARDIIHDFTTFLAFVANICVARHVDIDGIQHESGQTAVHGMYMKAVDSARQLVRMLEVAVQSIYDDSASLLMTTQALRQADYDQSEQDRAACYTHLTSLVNTMEANTKVVDQTFEALLQVGLDQADLALGDYNGSIGWRLSRVSVIESTLRPLVTPSTARGFDRDSTVDMAHALSKVAGSGPPAYSDQDGSDQSHSGNEDLPPTPTWESGQSSEDLNRPASPVDSAAALDLGGPSDDEDLEGPASAKSPPRGNKLFQVLGAEAPSHYIKKLNADATPWYLKPDYIPGDIIMDAKDGTVKAGTVQALVQRLTSHENPDTKFIKTFLMTWKSFTTFEELFNLLVDRYWLEPPEGMKPNEMEDWTKMKQHVVRTRILNTFKTMVVDDDDVLDSEDYYIFDRMKQFVLSDQVGHLPAAKQTLVWIDRAQAGGGGLKRTMVNNQAPPQSIVPRSLNKKIKLLDIDPIELARQLTIMESQLFLKIRPMECILRSREQRIGREDHIATIIHMTNQMSHWVADMILLKEDSKRRATIIKYFISVADRCRQLNNFSTMIALVSGMNNPATRRLKRTWEQVNQRSISQLDACDRTMDTNKNFNNYRNILAKVTPPCVPFFGLYLTQLTFIQDGNPDMIEDKINFGKRHRAAEVINDIKRWQTRPYNLQPVPGILSFIEESLNVYPDPERLKDELWNLSLEREPREREDEKMARLLQESGFL